MKDGTLISCSAIAVLGLMETAAIITKTDGAYFLPVVAAISAIAGVMSRPQLEKAVEKLAGC